MKKQFKKLFVQPIQDGAKRRRYVRLQLEGLEERYAPCWIAHARVGAARQHFGVQWPELGQHG